MWNEKEVSWYDTGPTVWHGPLTTPMTLTLEFQGQSLKLLYLRNDMERKGCELSIHDHDVD